MPCLYSLQCSIAISFSPYSTIPLPYPALAGKKKRKKKLTTSISPIPLPSLLLWPGGLNASRSTQIKAGPNELTLLERVDI